MSEPTTFQFAVVYVESPTTPGTFVKLCGIETSGFNTAVATNGRARRDCALPGKVPENRLRVTSQSRTLSGSGVFNVDQIEILNVLPGKRRTYQFQMLDLSDPDDETGVEIGTWEGPGVCTALNIGGTDNEDGTVSITIESDGAWTYTAAA